MAELRILFAGKQTAVYRLTNETKYSIGRSEDADIQLNAAVVSPLHAELAMDKFEKWVVRALDDAYLLQNGRKVTETALNKGIDTRIGPYSLSVIGAKEGLSIRDRYQTMEPKKRVGLLVALFVVAILFNILFTGGDEKSNPQLKAAVTGVAPQDKSSNQIQNLEQLTDGNTLSKKISKRNNDETQLQTNVKEAEGDDQEVQDSLRVRQLRAKYISWAEGFTYKGNYEEAIVRLNAGLEKLQKDPTLSAMLTQTKADYARQLMKNEAYVSALRVLSGKGMDSQELQQIKTEIENLLNEKKNRQRQIALHKKELERQLFIVEKKFLTDDIEPGQKILDKLISDSTLEEMPGLREKVLLLVEQYKQKQSEFYEKSKLLSSAAVQRKNIIRNERRQCLQLRQAKKYVAARDACQKALSLTMDGDPENKELKLWLYSLDEIIKDQIFSRMKEAEKCEQEAQWKCVIEKLREIKLAKSADPEIEVKIDEILARQRIKARTLYQDALSYESVGNLAQAQDSWQRVVSLLPKEESYYKKAKHKLEQLR